MSEESLIKVGNSIYPVIKTGREQAKQVLRLTKWLRKYGMSAMDALQGRAGHDGDMTTSQSFDMILEIIESLSEDALLDLFQVVTGCTNEEADRYFDVADLVDTVITLYNEQPSIQRLVQRFFSVPNSTESSEELPTTSE